MVEPLKKEDIIEINNGVVQCRNLTPNSVNECPLCHKNQVIEVSRIKEIVKDIISFSCTTNSKVELQCKIINIFGVLFDTQSPMHLDKPSQTSSYSGESEPVGVSSLPKISLTGKLITSSLNKEWSYIWYNGLENGIEWFKKARDRLIKELEKEKQNYINKEKQKKDKIKKKIDKWNT